VAHINDLPILGNAQVALGILFLCVTCQPFYLTWTIYIYIYIYILKFLLTSFDRKVMQVCGDIMGSGSWESI